MTYRRDALAGFLIAWGVFLGYLAWQGIKG